MWLRPWLLLAWLAMLGGCDTATRSGDGTAHAAAVAVQVGPLTLRRIGSPTQHVRHLAVDARGVWVATRGGGLYGIANGRRMHFDVGHGLPTAQIWQVAPIGAGRLVVATGEGLVVLDPARVRYRRITPPAAHAHLAGADLVAASPRGRLIVQLTAAETNSEETSPVSLWSLQGETLEPWSPVQGRAVEATAAYVDPATQCLHVAGVEPQATGPALWLVRECRDQITPWSFRATPPHQMLGVAALARDPVNGRLVLAVVRQRGPDPATRRYAMMEVNEQGALVSHCSRAEYPEEVTGLVADAPRRRLIVARHGVGLHALDCADAPPRARVSDDPRLRAVTALAADPAGQLWVGTSAGLYLLPTPDVAPQPVLQAATDALPADALPTDVDAVGQRALLSSARDGVVELRRADSGWQAQRRWQADAQFAPTVYGPAVYGAQGDELLVVLRSRGIARVGAQQVRLIGSKQGLMSPHILQLAASARGFWVAMGATPLDPQGAALQFFAEDGTTTKIPLRDRVLQPGGALLTWPETRVWFPSRAGVVQTDTAGRFKRLSRQRVESVFRNARTGAVAAVGASVERLEASGFVPVLFAIPEDAGNSAHRGHPVDVVIDNRGRWFILFSGGRLVLLDAERRFVAILGPAEGFPATARKLLHVAATDEILVGTGQEGVFSLSYR